MMPELIFVADSTVNWYVDYNDENVDDATGLPVGTLRIPSFLIHNDKFIDSRSILKRSCDYVAEELKKLIAGKTIKGDGEFSDMVKFRILFLQRVPNWNFG